MSDSSPMAKSGSFQVLTELETPADHTLVTNVIFISRVISIVQLADGIQRYQSSIIIHILHGGTKDKSTGHWAF